MVYIIYGVYNVGNINELAHSESILHTILIGAETKHSREFHRNQARSIQELILTSAVG